MAIRQIVKEGDEVLRKKCFDVTSFDDKLATLLDDMKDTMRKAEGAGLAGPQVGILRNVFVVDVEEGYFEFVNPKIIKQKGKRVEYEACLSIPKRHGYVERPTYVKVSAFDRYGKPFELVAKDFFAKAFCHEYDHLFGVLYIDKVIDIEED